MSVHVTPNPYGFLFFHGTQNELLTKDFCLSPHSISLEEKDKSK